MRKTSRSIIFNKKNYQIENKAIFCGSFNPFHDGHLDILKKALKDFNFVYVLVCQNEQKQKADLGKIAKEIEFKLINYSLQRKIIVLINNGLTANFIRQLDTKTIVRGYRNRKDLRYEKALYKKYLEVNPSIFYKLYKANRKHRKLSSSTIKNVSD